MAISGNAKILKKPKKKEAEEAKVVGASADGSTAGNLTVTDQNISSPRKRTKDPGVRVIGGRIYDSENGRTCHQCRQKTMDFSALCKNVRQNKPCKIRFCHKCLLNRYGENAEETNGMDSWKCPKCRGICNCSLCMKKRGEKPTGILIHTAKATGFSSVSDMLLHGLDLNKCSELKSPRKGSLSSIKKASMRSNEGASQKRKRDNGSTEVPLGDTKPSSTGKDVKKKHPKLHKSSSKGLNTQNTRNKDGMHTSSDGSSEEVKRTSKNVESSRVVSDHPVDKKKPQRKTGTRKVTKQQRSMPAKKPNSKKLVKEEKMASVEAKTLPSEQTEPILNVHVQDGKEKLLASPKHENLQKIIKAPACDEDADVLPQGEEEMACIEAKTLSSEEIEPMFNVHIQAGKQLLLASPKLKSLQKIIKAPAHDGDADVLLPQGEEVKAVAGIDFSADDIGPALQFLEFCAAFGKVLDVKRGQPESILRELTRGSRIERRGLYSSAAQFHVKLLDLLQNDMDEESSVLRSSASGSQWLEQLHRCISKLPFALKELPLDYLNRGADGYCKLDPSKKLRVLNFLCDEALCTERMRNWIDEENLKFSEKKKEYKENLVEMNKKEKDMKQKMKDEMARAFLSSRDGAPISLAESQDILSKIKREANEAHAEKLKALEMKAKFKKQRADAVRTEHIVFDKSGRIYWRLTGDSSASGIMLQDVGIWDSISCRDKWFIYDDKQEKALQKYIFSLRKRYKPRRANKIVNLLEKENLQHQSSSNSSSPSSAVEAV